jgi:nitrate reductase delta subunit
MRPQRRSQQAPSTHAQVREGGRAVILQAASLLLDYPGGEAGEDGRLIAAALGELPAGPVRTRLDEFLAWWLALSPLERQTHYVEIFDLGEHISLYLTEAHPGESRQRGPALIALRQAYRQQGADVTTAELPDYLPLMLEVAANVPGAFAVLAAERQPLERLRRLLTEAGSPFHLVIEAVLAVLPPVRGGVATAEAALDDRETRPSPPGLPRDSGAP